jgi:transposase, IS5 family
MVLRYIMSNKDNERPSFADFVFQKVCPDNRFLDEMDEIIPWEVFEKFFNKHLKRRYKKAGRPAYPLMLMFKIHLLQQWYDLSDAQAEYQINDRLSFRKFLGLGMESNVPDSTTIENFRHLMEDRNWTEKLIKLLDNYFIENGLIRKEGNIVDATFLRANSKPTKNEDKKTDIDAEFGHKGFGYSGTINMDKCSKLIRKTNTTSANILDYQDVENALTGDEKELYGDKGYAPVRNDLTNKLKTCKVFIMFKRQRGKKNEPTPKLPQLLQDANKSYSKIRSRVEHAFATIKETFGFKRLRYRGLERVANKFNSLAIAYNLRRMGYLLKRKPAESQPICA